MLTTHLTYIDKYCADTGQLMYLRNAENKGAGLKIGRDHELAKHIENRIIKDKYSPDAVIGEIRRKGMKFKASICTKTLYNYIDKEVFANISNKDLVVKRKPRKGAYNRVRIAHNNLKGTSIEERPDAVEDREEYGHWEMDCVVGKQGGSGAALLVLTERSTREEIIRKMPDKTQESVQQALISLNGNKEEIL
jgi:transposase, IS30 family